MTDALPDARPIAGLHSGWPCAERGEELTAGYAYRYPAADP